MNTDIRLHVEFFQHHKTRRMVRKLGLQGPMSLLTLWCYAAKNCPDGVLRNMDDDDIEDAAGWPTKRVGEFVAYCRANRWLDPTPDGQLAIHEWATYNPWAADVANRSQEGRKGAHERYHVKRGITKPGCEFCSRENGSTPYSPPIAPLVGEPKEPHGGDYAPAPAPSPSPLPSPERLSVETKSLSPVIEPAPVPKIELPADGLEAIEIVSRAVDAFAPRIRDRDEMTYALWLRDINPDPWWIAAALAAAEQHAEKATTLKYLTGVLRGKRDDGMTCDDMQGFVRHRLRMSEQRRANA